MRSKQTKIQKHFNCGTGKLLIKYIPTQDEYKEQRLYQKGLLEEVWELQISKPDFPAMHPGRGYSKEC